MGKIGRQAPKALLPIFDKRLIDIHIDSIRTFFDGDIYINVHHLHEKIRDYIYLKKYRDARLKVYLEEKLLEVGGSVHNLARRPDIDYSGVLLIINCDLIHMIDLEKVIESALNALKECGTVLMLHETSGGEYNTIRFDSNHWFQGIDLAGKNTRGYTYAGIALVDLSKIEPSFGKLSFFESVANNPSGTKVQFLDEGTSIDVGTIDLYKSFYGRVFSALSRRNGHKCMLLDYLKRHKIIDEKEYLSKVNKYVTRNYLGSKFHIEINENTLQLKL